jgi:cytosine/uracil/thiamine/allantoin permease
MQNIENSSLYSRDLAPIPVGQRSWTTLHLAALWVGMAVCIPTYLLASYMVKSGLTWLAALVIIGLANLVITLPMVFNGHAGVKYGIPFPVFGRSVFGIKGVHVVTVVRGFVACGWFGVQTWVGGLAIYSIWNVLTGSVDPPGLGLGEFVAFAVFWVCNMYFIWNGIESIKWLENLAAPILIIIGLALVYWGYQVGGSFANVLEKGKQLGKTSVVLDYQTSTDKLVLTFDPIVGLDGVLRVDSVRCMFPVSGLLAEGDWQALPPDRVIEINGISQKVDTAFLQGQQPGRILFSGRQSGHQSSMEVYLKPASNAGSKFWQYLLWFTAMVGFWATMSISISDITRFARSQNDQVKGQFLGLPGTMLFYSFVGIFVTSASVLAFDDILIAEDAPWDPISLVSRFNHPLVVVFAQLAMLVATLSTNIAANVIAPANAFSNLWPQKLGFREGGLVAGLIGVFICPWWLMNEISGLLIFVSGLLGPVLGVLLCDYFVIRRTQLDVAELFNPQGEYAFGGSGFNIHAMLALALGALTALVGYWVPSLDFLFSLSWFTGFLVAFVVYWLLAARQRKN